MARRTTDAVPEAETDLVPAADPGEVAAAVETGEEQLAATVELGEAAATVEAGEVAATVEPGEVAAGEVHEDLAAVEQGEVYPVAVPPGAWAVDQTVFDEPTPPLAMEVAGPPAVGAPFAIWLSAYGRALCGEPISELLPMESGRAQYFENMALFAASDGSVSPLPIGEAALRSATADAVSRESAVALEGGPTGAYPITDMTASLARHAIRRYPTRPLSQIRHLVIHHTGASAHLTPVEIAREHVEANGWPGIGYHYVIDGRGAVAKTQDLNTETYHARQFNPASVGIALSGDFTADVPSPRQIEAAAFVLADLLRDLGLPSGAIRGHREMVQTPCPGDAFLTLWKPRLVRLVEARLAAAAV